MKKAKSLPIITKSDLKKNELAELISNSIKWGQDNQQLVLAIFISIAVVFAFAWFALNRLSETHRTAWERLSIAQNFYQGRQYDQSQNAISTILSGYKSTPAAPFANLLQGDIYFVQGKNEEAVKTYKKVLEKVKKGAIVPIVLSNLATALEDSGKVEEARTHYNEFIDKYPEHYLTARTYAALGRIQERLGKNIEALSTYEKLITLYPTTIWAQEARQITSELQKNTIP